MKTSLVYLLWAVLLCVACHHKSDSNPTPADGSIVPTYPGSPDGLYLASIIDSATGDSAYYTKDGLGRIKTFNSFQQISLSPFILESRFQNGSVISSLQGSNFDGGVECIFKDNKLFYASKVEDINAQSNGDSIPRVSFSYSYTNNRLTTLVRRDIQFNENLRTANNKDSLLFTYDPEGILIMQRAYFFKDSYGTPKDTNTQTIEYSNFYPNQLKVPFPIPENMINLSLEPFSGYFMLTQGKIAHTITLKNFDKKGVQGYSFVTQRTASISPDGLVNKVHYVQIESDSTVSWVYTRYYKYR